MRTCMMFLPVLFVAAGLSPSPATAQSEPAPRGWWSRVFPNAPARTTQTITLRDPGTIMRQDQRRETILEQTESARRMATDKQRRLFELRGERDRRVAVAIANAAATQPFHPPETVHLTTADPSGEVATGTSSSSRNTEPPKHGTTETPPFLPGDRNKTIAERTAETVDGIVGNIGQKIFNTPAAQPLPPGLFALALIGMFLVPAGGVTLLFLGFAHCADTVLSPAPSSSPSAASCSGARGPWPRRSIPTCSPARPAMPQAPRPPPKTPRPSTPCAPTFSGHPASNSPNSRRAPDLASVERNRPRSPRTL